MVNNSSAGPARGDLSLILLMGCAPLDLPVLPIFEEALAEPVAHINTRLTVHSPVMIAETLPFYAP